MDFDVPEITWEDVRQQVINRRLLLANSTPKWINSIWDQHHAIQPAMLRVPLVVCSFLLLWAVNVFFIERAKVPYYSVLSVKSISALAVFLRALAALGIYGLLVTSANVLHAELEQSMISFYLLVFVVAMLPFVPGLDYRLHFLRLLKQVFFSVPNRTYLALNPHARGGLLNLNRQRPGNSSPTAALTIEVEEAQSLLKENENAAISVVPFVEILLADALCSLSKVFKDLGTSAIAIFAYVSGTNVTSYHYSGMVIVALMASLPYL